MSSGVFEEGHFIKLNRVYHVSHSFEGHYNLCFTKKAVSNSIEMVEDFCFVPILIFKRDQCKILVQLFKAEAFVVVDLLGE